MLLSGLFIATAARSDASPPPACPDGFSLTADAKNCFQAAVITSADNPNTCPEGQLTPDGTTCFIAADIIPQEGETICPKGFSPDDSLGGTCARFEDASVGDPTCDALASGEPGGCFINVAKGPAGDATCSEGELVGSNCVVTGPAPVNGASSCPVSTTVIEDGSECFTLIAAPTVAGVCEAPFFAFGTVCRTNNTGTDQASLSAFTCPSPSTGETVTDNMGSIGGVTKIVSCTYTPFNSAGACPAGTTEDPSGDCRRPVDLVPGALACSDGFGIVSGECIRFVAPTAASAHCPIGSVEDSSGQCRKPVADSPGAPFCADPNAALNGTSCVFTTGFLINPAPSLFSCSQDAERAVIGSGDDTTVICILGPSDENTTSGPSCLQGVLSTDNAFCLVPRIDTAPAAAVAAPVPSFTG